MRELEIEFQIKNYLDPRSNPAFQSFLNKCTKSDLTQ